MDVLDKCQSVIRMGPEQEVDEYAIKEMRKRVKAHMQREFRYLADVAFIVNGELYENLLDALLEVDSVKSIDIKFLRPDINENWDFNRPTKIIKVIEGGFGGVAFFNYNPKAIDKWANAGELIEKKAMIRVFPVDVYVPRSIATMSKYVQEDPPRPIVPDLWTIEYAWMKMKELGALPITARICAYTKEERFAYDIDVINGKLIRDFRAERMPVTRKKSRDPEDYFYFDRIYASEDMPSLTRNIFEAIFESEGMTAADISHIFKITVDMANNNLRALLKRGLLDKEGQPPYETYLVTSEILKKKMKK
jgi:hypothetical protein